MLLFRLIDSMSVKVSATCGGPGDIQGQSVKEVSVFQTCPGNEEPSPTTPPATEDSSPVKAPKKIKPKPALLEGVKPKPSKAKAKAKPLERPRPSVLPKEGKKSKKTKKNEKKNEKE